MDGMDVMPQRWNKCSGCSWWLLPHFSWYCQTHGSCSDRTSGLFFPHFEPLLKCSGASHWNMLFGWSLYAGWLSPHIPPQFSSLETGIRRIQAVGGWMMIKLRYACPLNQALDEIVSNTYLSTMVSVPESSRKGQITDSEYQRLTECMGNSPLMHMIKK